MSSYGQRRSMTHAEELRARITEAGISIYDPAQDELGSLIMSREAREELLGVHLVGISVAGLPLRARSKVIKELVCEALGYQSPGSFRRTQPRFPGQDLDVYAQQSRNLQAWNEDLSATRQYAILAIDTEGAIVQVRVTTGLELAAFDSAGTQG